MKTGTKLSLFSSACALFLSVLSAHASAAWQTVGNGHAAVASGGFIYALTNTWVSGQGWQIKQYNPTFPNNGWQNLSTAAGTNLAMDVNGTGLYAYGLNSIVWRKNADGDPAGAWTPMPTNACEGGTISLRQLPGHNNMTANTTPFVITDANGIRYWNASCWSLMPALPVGVANDIAILPSSGNFLPWVANGSGNIFAWSTSGHWNAISVGITTGLNSNLMALGSDSKTIWNFDGVNGWTRQQDWSFGPIIQLGTTHFNGFIRDIQEIAVTVDQNIWVLGLP